MTNKVDNIVKKGILISGLNSSKEKWQRNFVIDNISNLFDLDSINWKEGDFNQQKHFLCKSIKLAIQNKTWNNYRYIIENSIAKNVADELLSKLIEYELTKIENKEEKEVGAKFHCEIHRAFYYNPQEKQSCMICDLRETINTNYKKVRFNLKKEFWQGEIFKIVPEKLILDKKEAFQVLDKFSDNENLISLGNIWVEIKLKEAIEMIRNGLAFDLAFSSSRINDDKFVYKILSEINQNFNKEKLICCFTNSLGNPWGNSSGGWDITYDWTFNVAVIIVAKEEIIFAKFVSED